MYYSIPNKWFRINIITEIQILVIIVTVLNTLIMIISTVVLMIFKYKSSSRYQMHVITIIISGT